MKKTLSTIKAVLRQIFVPYDIFVRDENGDVVLSYDLESGDAYVEPDFAATLVMRAVNALLMLLAGTALYTVAT